MLKVFIHSGTLDTRKLGNQLATLDIAYAKRDLLADYMVAMNIKGVGEVPPDTVLSYPRWSASLWDLVARALTRILYRADQAPPTQSVDRRCAYATKMCFVVERATMDDQGLVLATGEIVQMEGKRGHYVVNLEEDILGRHSATFTYGMKTLQHTDLVLRALCWALYGKDTLGKRPALLLPSTMKVGGVDRFHIDALPQPARTGFDRYRAPLGIATAPDPMPTVDAYASFLKAG
jgi:hypothetical protein